MSARFRFDGQEVEAGVGQSLAAALTAAGIRAFRRTVTGAPRGVFCGMGVCQDCLVTVDGVPNRRACMTPAADGLAVITQEPLPAIAAVGEAASRPAARVIEPEVLVVGGGAAGLSAAIAAARAGAEVVVLDERHVAGGQYYKQPAAGVPLDAQQAEGGVLLAEARASGAEILDGVEIWGAFDGLLFLAEWRGGALIARPRTVIVATGAYERPRTVPGWTLPGVMTTGAAQTLWRSYRTLPGRRVAVCGSGPLNLQVALELARGGAELVLAAEAAPSPLARPLAGIGLGLAGPALALRGAAMLAALRRRGVPVRHRTVLLRVDAAGEALRAVLEGPSADEIEVEVDALCMNEGFEPQNEILRLLGAEMRYDPAFGQLRCVRDADMATSVSGLYAAGGLCRARRRAGGAGGGAHRWARGGRGGRAWRSRGGLRSARAGAAPPLPGSALGALPERPAASRRRAGRDGDLPLRGDHVG